MRYKIKSCTKFVNSEYNDAFDELPNSEKSKNKQSEKVDMSGDAIRNRFYAIMEDYHSSDEIKRKNALGKAMKELEGLIHLVIKRSYSTYAKAYYYDLLQEGYIGVAIGMERYDPKISMPSTYFYPYIQHEMQDFISKNVNKISSHYTGNLKKVNKAIEELEKDKLEYTKMDIAIQTGLSFEAIDQVLKVRNSANEIYIDESTINIIENELQLNKYSTPEQQYIDKEETTIIHKAIDKVLTPEEAQVVKLYFGFGDREPQNETGVAKELHISKATVKKLLNRSIRKLRQSDLMTFFNVETSVDELELIDVPVSSPAIAPKNDLDFLDILCPSSITNK